VRTVAAAVVAVAGAVLGAQILGEYTFVGWRALPTGLLTGLALAEAVVAVAGRRGAALAALTAAAVAVALVWAGAISVRGRGEPVPAGAWLAAVVGGAVAAVRAGGRSAGSRSPRRR
jgi:hypothetical protein